MFCQSLAEQGESLVALPAEHGIVDARHQRCLIRQGWRQGYLLLPEFLSSVGQVQLIEHAMVPVAGQSRPVLFPERTALGKEPAEIGFG